MTPTIKTAALIASFALLAVLAIAGWTRNPEGANLAANNLASPNGVYDSNRATYSQPAYSNMPAQQAGYDPAVNCVEPVYTNAAYASSPRYQTYNRPRVIRTNYVERQRDVVVRSRRGRSTAKSVAIVGGSAGVGAAIGAIAGGGKGAGIGALSGGAAGFIYDRLTHNR
jgi:hypothetical protein